jgi:hypothetical protein
MLLARPSKGATSMAPPMIVGASEMPQAGEEITQEIRIAAVTRRIVDAVKLFIACLPPNRFSK